MFKIKIKYVNKVEKKIFYYFIFILNKQLKIYIKSN